MPSKHRAQPIPACITPKIALEARAFPLMLCLFLAVLLSACTPGLLSASLPDVVGAAPTDAPALAPSSPTETLEPSATPAPTLIPSATPTPTVAPCRETAGQFKRFELLSPSLKKPLNYRMYFPPCYDDSGATRYPVLYMLHGQTYNDDQWVRLGIGTALDELIRDKAVSPFLIVLPYEVDTFADPYADGYAKALLETLIPWIDAFHPTCAEAACRAIGGLSRGGAWSFLLALDHPELFGAAGGHSMVPFGGMARRLPNQLRAVPESGLPRLWIDTGKGDIYLPDLKKYEELLTQLEVPHEYTLIDGAHEEKYWSAHVKEYLRWYAAGFPKQ